MAASSRRPDRRSLRLPGRDYRQPGHYYVTLCVDGKACLFGRVVRRKMRMSAAGRLMLDQWQHLGAVYPHVVPAEVIVMPNHLHGILWFREAPLSDRASLGEVIGAFKSRTTVEYGRGVQRCGWRRFAGRLWQRGYWERVLRDEDEIMHAHSYILMNPTYWDLDPMNPRPAE